MKHQTTIPKILGAPCIAIVLLAGLAPAPAYAVAGTVIPHGEITYAYPLDFLAPGPQQGDPSQPRSDVADWMGDLSGDELANGVLPAWPEDDLVGFNEYHGTSAGNDNGLPQPRIEFDLGGPRALTAIVLWTKINTGLFLLAGGLFHYFYWLPPADRARRGGAASRSSTPGARWRPRSFSSGTRT